MQPSSAARWPRERRHCPDSAEMSPGPTFERVYLALKAQLMSARFAPGEHLEPVGLGEEVHASITPVRDALHRLVGERLAEAPRHDGFRVPLLTEAALRHLYAWNMDLALLALRSARGPVAGAEAPSAPTEASTMRAELAEAAARFFSAVGSLSANPEHGAAIAAANDRLAAPRLAEAAVLDGMAGELDQLARLLAKGDLSALRRAIAAYHRRRARAAPHILEALHGLAVRNRPTTGI
jgi:DNA-binding GntR family transcriptional regulator